MMIGTQSYFFGCCENVVNKNICWVGLGRSIVQLIDLYFLFHTIIRCLLFWCIHFARSHTIWMYLMLQLKFGHSSTTKIFDKPKACARTYTKDGLAQGSYNYHSWIDIVFFLKWAHRRCFLKMKTFLSLIDLYGKWCRIMKSINYK